MFFFSSRRRHTRSLCDWSSDVCSSDLDAVAVVAADTWAAKQGLAALDIRWDDGPNANLTTADIVQQLATASEKSGVVARKDGDVAAARSEERRVGKECRCRWSREHEKKKSAWVEAG